MIRTPKGFEPLFKKLLSDFTKPATGKRAVWLMLAAVLVTGNRTVSGLVRLISLVQYVSRPLALLILVALYRDKKTNQRVGRRHKTAVELMCGLLA